MSYSYFSNGIISCSYSCNWINDCVKTLNDLGIPSCGHHTQEQGILLKIFSFCKSKEYDDTFLLIGKDFLYGYCVIALMTVIDA